MMGAVVSSTKDDVNCGLVSELTQPDKDNWLSQHASACNVSNDEISALWKQFKDLGCNADGELTVDVLMATGKGVSTAAKILQMIPRSKDNALTFQIFCNMSRWLADAGIEQKVRAVFQCLNKGGPLDLVVLREILNEIYCDESPEVVERSAKVFMYQVGDMGSHMISEENFVTWAMQLPKDTLQTIMDFKCSPSNSAPEQKPDNDQAKGRFAEPPSTKDIMKVSRMASRRDWALLANKLGFTQADISQIKGDTEGQDREKVEQLVTMWVQRNDAQATLAVLNEALRASDMSHIAYSLESSN